MRHDLKATIQALCALGVPQPAVPGLQLHRRSPPPFPLPMPRGILGLCYQSSLSRAVAETLGKWHMNTDESEKSHSDQEIVITSMLPMKEGAQISPPRTVCGHRAGIFPQGLGWVETYHRQSSWAARPCAKFCALPTSSAC